MASKIVVKFDDWETSAVKYMQPKINKQGGKAVSIISLTSSRGLQISTPLMLTWGCQDYVDKDTGVSDGKYSVQLQFPRDGDATADSKKFLEKMKAFEQQIIEDGVKNSEAWFGKKKSRELVEEAFYPFVKYPKIPESTDFDYSKPPKINVKVPLWEGEWKTEIYDQDKNKIFPNDYNDKTPIDLIQKGSKIACVLQCGGVWIGGGAKAWGVTWKLAQCIVKPRDDVSISGVCQIDLSPQDSDAIRNQVVDDEVDEVAEQISKVEVAPKVDETHVDDSEDEAPAPPKKVVKAKAPEPEEPEEKAPVKKVVKKIVKKA